MKLTLNVNLFFTLISVLFLSAIILSNNIYNAFLVLIPLLLSIIDIKIINPSLGRKKAIIALEEKELNNLKNIDLLKKQMDKIHYRVYQLARLSLVKKYVYLAILVVTALLTTVFNETFYLPYVIFYFVLTYMLLEQYNGFLRYPYMKIEEQRCRVKLNNILN